MVASETNESSMTTNTANTSSTNSEDGTSPKLTDNDQAWQQSGNSSNDIFHVGKVGINTSEPTESLTVHGSILSYYSFLYFICLYIKDKIE